MTARKKAKRPTRRTKSGAAPISTLLPTREGVEHAKHLGMLELIARTKARAEFEAEADWLLMRALDGQPMVPGSARGGSEMTDAVRAAIEGDGDEGPQRRGGESPTLARGDKIQRHGGR